MYLYSVFVVKYNEQEIIIGDASYSDAVPMPSTHTHIGQHHHIHASIHTYMYHHPLTSIENSGDPVTITCMDALTSFGIRLWSPKARQWCEVSTTGTVPPAVLYIISPVSLDK